ncbi:MAG: DUF1460 domain-containing protein [Ignavibacteriales bacterium]|nr:DUF1460 domain-containing protein [Ignavibacteriales bacterium]
MKTLITLLITALFSILTFSQVDFTEKDKEICKSKFQLAVDKQLNQKAINDVIAEIGKSFLGLEYEAHSLEKEGDERLVVHLTGLDCTTFLENALVFARCVKSGKTSFEDYQNELTKVRYRDGKIAEYPSRLHYFSDWFYDNEKKGIVENITKSIGGKICPSKVGFMTKYRDKYVQIATNDKFYNLIKKQEDEINGRGFYYIPKADVSKIEDKIGNGYLIAITSGVDGLDIAHVGIAVKLDDGRIHFLHAPLSGAKVQITEKPLHDYLAKNKNHTGIVVLKPLELTSK